MAVGTPLSELRRQLRAEVGQSLNTAQGVNAQAQYDLILARQQDELWEQYQWPHLEARMDVVISAGQTEYPYPAGVSYEAINEVWCWDDNPNSQPSPVYFKIPRDTFSNTNQTWPVQFWQNKATITDGKTVPGGAIKIWPSPNKAGTLILIVQAPVNPLVADTDEAVIDDRAIVLFTAAEILAQQKNEGAANKLQKANQYIRRLLANQGAMKRRITVLGGAQMVEAAMQPEYSAQRFRVPYPNA